MLSEFQTEFNKAVIIKNPKPVSLRLLLVIPLLGLAITLISGCYPDWPEHSGTAQVEGEVFLDGFPLNQANVVFLPSRLKSQSGKVMPMVYGKCDARGMFKMANADGTPDVMAGHYDVLISRVDAKPDLVKEEKPEPGTDQKKTGRKYTASKRIIDSQIARSKAAPVSRAELIEQIDRNQAVPALYNRESNLKFEVVASPGIVRTKFDLSSIDPLLKK